MEKQETLCKSVVGWLQVVRAVEAEIRGRAQKAWHVK